MTSPKPYTNGFWMKLGATVTGAVAISFFGWLALAVIDIGKDMVEMKGAVDSLVETQRRENSTPPVDTDIERNTRSIERLEDGRR